jgi:hypothetical protein
MNFRVPKSFWLAEHTISFSTWTQCSRLVGNIVFKGSCQKWELSPPIMSDFSPVHISETHFLKVWFDIICDYIKICLGDYCYDFLWPANHPVVQLTPRPEGPVRWYRVRPSGGTPVPAQSIPYQIIVVSSSIRESEYFISVDDVCRRWLTGFAAHSSDGSDNWCGISRCLISGTRPWLRNAI